MTDTLDPREATLLALAQEMYTVQLTTFVRLGYPRWLAETQARRAIHQVMGVDLARVLGVLPDPGSADECVFDVRQLSACFGLEHDGSALNRLLERYDYQYQLSNGAWQLTDRTVDAHLGFLLPHPPGPPRIHWKSAVAREVITLEQARQAVEPPGEPNLLRRYYFTPRELGARVGLSTKRVNQLLMQTGYQTREQHGRGSRWEPTPQAWKVQACICGDRTLEWRPAVVEALVDGSHGHGPLSSVDGGSAAGTLVPEEAL